MAPPRRATNRRQPAGRTRVRVLGKPDDLVALSEEWGDLCDRGGAPTPFQRPEWMLPWLRLASPERLWIVTVSDAHGLVGLAPLLVADEDGARTVALLGSGITPYLDLIARPGLQQTVVEAVWSELRARRSAWDVCRLDDLPSRSALRRLPAPLGWRDEESPQEACPVLRLPPGAAGARAAPLPARQARRLGRLRRRAGRDGELELRRAEVHRWESTFDDVVRLHGERWLRRGYEGLFSPAPMAEFHREVARGFAAQGRLALYSLELNGQPIAALYGFVHGDSLYFYLGGFDPDRASLSPGTLLIGLAIEDAARRGVRGFDFLRGRESYKYGFGARDVVTFRRRLRPR